MNDEELSKLIGEFLPYPSKDQHYALRSFAKLVAAAEREKVARWQIGSGYATGHGETIEDLLVELEWQVRESEREACAKACEEYAHKYAKDDDDSKAQAWMMLQCAAAIRARGQHESN